MNLTKYFDINTPKTVSIALAVNNIILYSTLYNHNGIKDSNFQFPRDMSGLTNFLNNFTPFLMCVISKIVLYSSFKGTVPQRDHVKRLNFLKKGM